MERFRSTPRGVGGWPRFGVWAIGLASIGAIGSFDDANGTALRVHPLYYGPIALMAWQVGRGAGIAAAGLSAASWLLFNWLTGPEDGSRSILVANTAVNGASFIFVAWLIASLRQALSDTRELSRTDSLTTLRNALVLLSLSPVLLPAQTIQADTAQPLLELRIVQSGRSTVTKRFAGTDYRLGPPVVSDADVAAVIACAVNGLEFLVTLTPDGGRRLRQATADALGGHLAVLVEGRLWSEPPVIVSAVGDRPITIGVPASRQDAERLIATFRTRWRPRHPC